MMTRLLYIGFVKGGHMNDKKRQCPAKVLLQLFVSFLRIGLFTFGGGYAMIPLIQKETVENKRWISDEDILEIIAIAESTPGPIAINSATFVGIQVAGIPGALVATLGCILPACFIVTFLAFIYYKARGLSSVQGILKGIRPAVIAMIASAALSLISMALYGADGISAGLETIDIIAAGLFIASFAILRIWKPNPIAVMAGCGLAGIILYQLF